MKHIPNDYFEVLIVMCLVFLVGWCSFVCCANVTNEKLLASAITQCLITENISQIADIKDNNQVSLLTR